MVYETLLLVGVAGLVAQALVGSHARGHGGHAGHAAHGGHGHAAPVHAHGPQVQVQVHGHSHGASGRHHMHAAESEGAAPVHAVQSALMGLLSPLALCGICVGTGAAGLLLPRWIPGVLALALASVAIGLAFYLLAIRPLTELLLNFASTPATSLAGAVAQEAEAMGRFDESGHGIVRVTIDGQLVRLLATLDEPGATVQSGDRLLVVSIDSKRNTCRVTPL